MLGLANMHGLVDILLPLVQLMLFLSFLPSESIAKGSVAFRLVLLHGDQEAEGTRLLAKGCGRCLTCFTVGLLPNRPPIKVNDNQLLFNIVEALEVPSADFKPVTSLSVRAAPNVVHQSVKRPSKMSSNKACSRHGVPSLIKVDKAQPVLFQDVRHTNHFQYTFE